VLSTGASDGAIQATPLLNPLSMTPRKPNPSPTIRRSPIKSTFVIDEDAAVARTPDLPSAKVLGKRRAVDPPPELRFRSDLASLLPSTHVTSPDRRIQLSSDETMAFFINYCPSPVVTRSPTHHDSAISPPVDNLPLGYRGLYSSPGHTASTTNVLDGQQQPATMLYPLNTYPDATTDVGYFPDNFFSERPLGSGPLGWSPFQASLFTSPPSEPSCSSSLELPSPPVLLQKSRTRIVSSPLPRSPKLVMSHVLVPPLSRPKSDYVKLSSLVPLSVKKPRFNLAEGDLREALESAWQQTGTLGVHPNFTRAESLRRKETEKTTCEHFCVIRFSRTSRS